MANNKLAYPLIQQEQIKRVNRDKLAIIHHHRAVKRLKIQQTFASRILETVAISSIFCAGFFGMGALGCWWLEMSDANIKPMLLNRQQDWQTRKHICLGWMLVGFSSFLASASWGEKSHRQQ